MMMRLLHLVVIGVLVASAAYVYMLKFDSTLRAERVARLRSEIKRERDMTAALRAQWETLDNPARIQALAERHLALKPLDATQVDSLDHLPEHPQPADRADTNASREGAQRWHRRLAQGLLYGRGVDRAKKARARLGLALLVFSLVYLIIGGRLVLYAVAPESHVARRAINTDAVATARPDIQDRNGEVLATDVVTPSLFAAPRRIIDADEASELLTAVMPDLAGTDLRERLASKRGFVWLKREISAKQQLEVHHLGIPGVGFLDENKRVYPNGEEVSHVIGHVNIDNQGIAGIEKWLDSSGLADLHLVGLASEHLQKPVELAVDLRVQHALRAELIAARAKFRAVAAAGVLSDVRTGEVVSMVSVPDYDPNNPREALDPTRINRLTTGVFEMGST